MVLLALLICLIKCATGGEALHELSAVEGHGVGSPSVLWLIEFGCQYIIKPLSATSVEPVIAEA